MSILSVRGCFLSVHIFSVCVAKKLTVRLIFFLDLHFCGKVKVHTKNAQAKNLTAKNTRAYNLYAKKALAGHEWPWSSLDMKIWSNDYYLAGQRKPISYFHFAFLYLSQVYKLNIYSISRYLLFRYNGVSYQSQINLSFFLFSFNIFLFLFYSSFYSIHKII